MTFRVESNMGVGKPFNFMVLALGWYIFSFLFKSITMPPNVYLAWVLLSTTLSMLSLSAIGYFNHYVPKPKMSGIITLLLVLPFSAIFSKWALVVIAQIPVIRYFEALKASIFVAILFGVVQMVVFRVHRAIGRKWLLATYLLPNELEALRAQIETSEAADWITVRPCDPFGSNGSAAWHPGETLVISRSAAKVLNPDLLAFHLRGQRVLDFRQVLKELSGRLPLNYSDGWSFLLGSTFQSFALRLYFYVKEFVEVIFSAVLLVMLSPLLGALALGVYLTSGNPILYRQARLGYQGKMFLLYKFRTMPVTAESNGPQWAKENDPRLGKFGRWLRKTRLDELPQLYNVIRGDLSFVGPRPERPEFYKILTEKIPLFPLRLLVRPGITGWAQVNNGYAGSVDESKMKLEYDLFYVQHMSPQIDFHVMLSTAAMMVRGHHGR